MPPEHAFIVGVFRLCVFSSEGESVSVFFYSFWEGIHEDRAWSSVLILKSVLESRSSRFLKNSDVSNQSLIGNKLSCHALG